MNFPNRNSRTFKDSGNINLINKSIVVINGIFVFNVDARFKPYEQIVISNSSLSDIKIGTNYKNDFNFLVMAGNERVLNLSCEDIRFKNVGASQIEINEIQITLRHTGEIEKNKLKEKIATLSQLAMLKNFF